MNTGESSASTLDRRHATSIDPGAVLPDSPLPLSEQQLAFKSAFCEEFALLPDGRGAGAAAVRAAVARVGGSAKAHARPHEVARRLLKQRPVLDRIGELRAAPMPAPPRLVSRAPRPANSATHAAHDLPPDTAARLAAAAFDPAVPIEAARAALDALQSAIDAKRASLTRPA